MSEDFSCAKDNNADQKLFESTFIYFVMIVHLSFVFYHLPTVNRAPKQHVHQNSLNLRECHSIFLRIGALLFTKLLLRIFSESF